MQSQSQNIPLYFQIFSWLNLNISLVMLLLLKLCVVYRAVCDLLIWSPSYLLLFRSTTKSSLILFIERMLS